LAARIPAIFLKRAAATSVPIAVGSSNATTSVTATFSGPQVSLSTTAVGPGTIQQSPSGASFNPGTPITLSAVPNANAAFTGWSGACPGSSNPVCMFTLNSNTSAIAMFENVYTLSTSVVGPGSITQSPAGASFNSGTPITLTAVPGAHATFTGPRHNHFRRAIRSPRKSSRHRKVFPIERATGVGVDSLPGGGPMLAK
jgi:Divergent InlB B-repeat domain